MIHLLLSTMALLMTSHLAIQDLPLFRCIIVADRASMVQVTTEPRFDRIILQSSMCEGPGVVLLVAVDLSAPWERTFLRFPAVINPKNKNENWLPQLRSSYSSHGLFVSDGGLSDNDYGTAGLASSSLPYLESFNKRLTGRILNNDISGKVDINSWNSYRSLAGDCVTLWPLRFQRETMSGQRVIINNDTVFYDFLVTNRAECELYMFRSGNIESHFYTVLPSRRLLEPGGHESKPWDKRYSVPGDINGPFAVVPYKKARYIVTPAGAVVRMVNADGKPCDKLTPVYDKAKVLAVVHDADEEIRYAFTTTHFFEVAEPVVLKPHAVKKFDTSNGAAGLETAFRCARAVRGLPPVPFPAPPK